MLALETVIHQCFVVGVFAMLVIAVILGVQVLTLGTQSHQDSNKERVKAATSPDTSAHEAYYIGFFHPFANAGGGGERVLWTMIKTLQEKYPFIVSVIYSGEGIEREELVRNVHAKFGLDIDPRTVYVVELTRCEWVQRRYQRMTLLLQSLASVALAAEAVNKFCPDVFVDTIGYAFTYPLIRLLTARIPVVSYTHYPTISSDMRTLVASREAGVNNDSTVANSVLLTMLKGIYYAAFAHMYAFSGSFAASIMTNSSWTHGHIVSLFDKPKMTRVVYPPCDTEKLAGFALDGRQPVIMSLAQFRPEKNHAAQIEAFADLLERRPELRAPTGWQMPRVEEFAKDGVSVKYPVLLLIGGARNIEDEARAEALRQQAKRLDVSLQVLVVVNMAWPLVVGCLRHASIGLHTMRDEHFGIGIVEMMAAGLLTIAHDSAGPKLDIITPAIRCSTEDKNALQAQPSAEAVNKYLEANEGDNEFPVGMLGETPEQFARLLDFALHADAQLSEALRRAGRAAAVTRFSEEAFRQGFYRRFDPVVRWLDNQRSDSDESFE
ncbi:asparagine-linked glycosylation protein [Coemansia sp. Benny D115]|nr:asparagine-linked glycosylation protein [Coemansia sp. Benny D115]